MYLPGTVLYSTYQIASVGVLGSTGPSVFRTRFRQGLLGEEMVPGTTQVSVKSRSHDGGEDDRKPDGLIQCIIGKHFIAFNFKIPPLQHGGNANLLNAMQPNNQLFSILRNPAI